MRPTSPHSGRRPQPTCPPGLRGCQSPARRVLSALLRVARPKLTSGRACSPPPDPTSPLTSPERAWAETPGACALLAPGPLTFHQLIQAGELLAAIDGVDGADTLGQVHVVRQGPGELDEESVEGAEAVGGDGVHQALEVPVPVAVEAGFPGFLLRAERLQGPRPVEAAVGAVRRAGDQPVAPRPRAAAGAAAARPGTLLPLVPLLEVLQLDAPVARHGELLARPPSSAGTQVGYALLSPPPRLQRLRSPNSASRPASLATRAAGDRSARPAPQSQPQLPLAPRLPAAPPAVAHKSILHALSRRLQAMPGRERARRKLGDAPRRAHASSHNAEDAVRAGPLLSLFSADCVGERGRGRSAYSASSQPPPAPVPARGHQRRERRGFPGPRRARALLARPPQKENNGSGSGGRSRLRPGHPRCRRRNGRRAGLLGPRVRRAARPLWGRARGGAWAVPSGLEAGAAAPQDPTPRRRGQALSGTAAASVVRVAPRWAQVIKRGGEGALLAEGNDFGETAFSQGQLCPSCGDSGSGS